MKYAWSVPEVTQTSQMDCGPACLKSVLQGFNIPVHFGRLREACQTSVDGTSVNVVEELACELGLDAQQVLVPVNNLHLPEAKTTPAILITQLPSNMTHFVVLWRSFGPWVQVMDPAHGRHWVRWEKLKDQAYIHSMSLPKTMWQTWANGEENKVVLTRRLTDLGFSAIEIQQQFSITFATAEDDAPPDNWLAIASLDAAITWTESLLQARAINKGREALSFLQTQYARAIAADKPWLTVIPAQYWWAVKGEENLDTIEVEAAVLVRINGVAEKSSAETPLEKKLIHSRINELESSPWAMLYKILLPQQRQLVRWLIPIILIASATVAIQALLFQGLLGMSSLLGQQQTFNTFIPLLFLFIVLSALMETPIAHITLTLGRQIESQFRIILFNKIPKIHDPYFRSRLLTDMAMRSHKLFVLRLIPAFLVAMFQQLSLIVFTLIGLFWLDFFSGLIALGMVALLLAISIFWQKTLHDLVARAETQAGVLGMFYFDALKGLKAIRSHAAQATFENEQEIQLSRWGATHYLQQRKQVGALLLLDLLGLLTIAALMLSKTMSIDAIAPSILWFYWILRLPYLVKHVSSLIMDLPQYGITLARYAELLEATEVEQIQVAESPKVAKIIQSNSLDKLDHNLDANGADNCAENNSGVAVDLTNVSLSVAGHWVLQNINLHINAGQHVAIVGESGAGKTSICELLLGWQAATAGELRVEGELLQGETLLQLRQQTAWVDANVQLWNRSLLENLNYDHANGKVSDAGLGHVLAGLPNGLQTSLGEGGKRLSGGEGQRVRIARALGVDKPRLVILDEPCRGLDRTAREQLLQKIRTTHANATLICITHDISEAIKFPQVVVVGQGTILEQGEPQLLLQKPESALSHLRNCEQQVLHTILQDETWEQLHLVNGRLQRGAITTHCHDAASPQPVESANA